MNAKAANEYLKAKVLTATAEQLQMLLYDGAIRFCEKAAAGLEQKQYDVSYSALSRAQKILLELHGSLKHNVAPELCANLASLYMWCYKRLVDANLKRDKEAVDQALQILRYQRETWALLLERLGRKNATAAAAKLDLEAPNARMEASFSASA